MSALTNWQYEGILLAERVCDNRPWSGECEAASAKDLRARLEARGIELRWCAVKPDTRATPAQRRTNLLFAASVVSIPLVALGFVPWLVTALFAGLGAVRATDPEKENQG